MPFMTGFERVGMEQCLLQGIEVALQLKFGDEGLKLMPELREIHDHVLLGKFFNAIRTTASPDDLRRIWTRKRRSKKRFIRRMAARHSHTDVSRWVIMS